LQLALVATAPRSDDLPVGISHSITARCSEGLPLVPVGHLGPIEDLRDGPVLHPPWTWDSLDLVLGSGDDAQVHQQSIKPPGGDQSLNPEGLKLLGVAVQLLAL
jgi:hypothetical protein